jgi:hypothetical protein
MQIKQVTAMPVTAKDPTLHGIISDLISDTALLAVHNRNFVVNNVPPDLRIETSGIIISSVLSKLFNTIIRHTKNCGILISARVYGLVVLVQVKSNGNISPALPEDMTQACTKALNTGGVIEVIHYEEKQASIAYCFLNVAGVA